MATGRTIYRLKARPNMILVVTLKLPRSQENASAATGREMVRAVPGSLFGEEKALSL
jgi:hypothetical protein